MDERKREELRKQLTEMRGALSTDRDAMHLLTFLQDRVFREQECYWYRFYSFATLHAGAFVLTTSTAVKNIPVELAWGGLVLAAVWIYIQLISLYYVDRAKPLEYLVREDFKMDFTPTGWIAILKPIFSKSWASSTDIAMCVPFIVLAAWIWVLKGVV